MRLTEVLQYHLTQEHRISKTKRQVFFFLSVKEMIYEVLCMYIYTDHFSLIKLVIFSTT